MKIFVTFYLPTKRLLNKQKKYVSLSKVTKTFHVIRENFKFETKITFWNFGTAILKVNCHIQNQHYRIFQNTKFHPKRNKTLKLRTKTANLGIFRKGFKKTIDIFETNTLKVV